MNRPFRSKFGIRVSLGLIIISPYFSCNLLGEGSGSSSISRLAETVLTMMGFVESARSAAAPECVLDKGALDDCKLR